MGKAARARVAREAQAIADLDPEAIHRKLLRFEELSDAEYAVWQAEKDAETPYLQERGNKIMDALIEKIREAVEEGLPYYRVKDLAWPPDSPRTNALLKRTKIQILRLYQIYVIDREIAQLQEEVKIELKEVRHRKELAIA